MTTQNPGKIRPSNQKIDINKISIEELLDLHNNCAAKNLASATQGSNLTIESIEIHSNAIAEAHQVIYTCSKLLNEFGIDDDFESEIPEKIKTEYVRNGLLTAIRIASSVAMESVEFLQNEVFVAKQAAEKNT
ncbi:MAG: hypothetical protein ABL919_08330 [Methylococcales bacterium]|nr:hypothetical protein [Methylococcaceae bacterium]